MVQQMKWLQIEKNEDLVESRQKGIKSFQTFDPVDFLSYQTDAISSKIICQTGFKSHSACNYATPFLFVGSCYPPIWKIVIL